MQGLLKRYLKFAGTSVAGTLTDIFVLWLLSDQIFNKGYWGEYIASPIISFQCAVAVNFIISYCYVWKDRTEGVHKSVFKLFAAYDLTCSAVFLLRFSVMLVIEKFTGWDVVLCNLLAMCCSGILNFTIGNVLIFK